MFLAPVFTHSPEEGVRLVPLVALVPLANSQQLTLCYPLQHFGDSLVLMVYDALLDRWSERYAVTH